MNWESKKFASSSLGLTKLQTKFQNSRLQTSHNLWTKLRNIWIWRRKLLSLFLCVIKYQFFSKFMLMSWKSRKLQTKMFSHDNFFWGSHTNRILFIKIFFQFLSPSFAYLQKIYTQYFFAFINLISSSFFTRIYQMKRLPDDVFAKRNTQLMFYIEIKRVGLTVQSNWLNLLRLWEFEALAIRKGVFPDWG